MDRRRKVSRVAILIAVMAAATAFLCLSHPAGTRAESAGAGSGNVVKAYYFHGKFRCPTCHRIEQYSREAVEDGFKDEISSGKLVFEEIDVEERDNEHFVDDYGLYTKSLVLSLVKDGKEADWKNLPAVWEYVGDKQKFIDYVREEVSAFLGEL